MYGARPSGVRLTSSVSRRGKQGTPRWQRSQKILVFDTSKDDTLWDFQQLVTRPGNERLGTEQFDFLRHRYRANILFVDGHVESIPMTKEGLSSVGLSKGIYE